MTDDERRVRKVPNGVEAYLVTLDIAHTDEIILMRGYDVYTDTHPCRAFSPLQWKTSTAPPAPDIGPDVPGGGAV